MNERVTARLVITIIIEDLEEKRKEKGKSSIKGKKSEKNNNALVKRSMEAFSLFPRWCSVSSLGNTHSSNDDAEYAEYAE